MRSLLLAFALSSCLASSSGLERARRQLRAAGESTHDVLSIAREEAPEAVSALEAVEGALLQAAEELELHGRIDTLAEALALLETARALATDPKVGLALVAVKAALLQVQASFP